MALGQLQTCLSARKLLNASGTIERFKVRLVVLGNNQVEGIVYHETFAPVAKMVSIRTFLVVAAIRNWEFHQMDVHNAFLHGDLDEKVYMRLPPGFSSSSGKFMQCPKEAHWDAAVRVVRYLKGHPGQAEYRSMAVASCELACFKSLLKSLGVIHTSPMRLFYNSQAALHIAANPVFHERTKHIEVDCHSVRDQIQAGNIITFHVRTNFQLADIFTKALEKQQFDFLLGKLGIHDFHAPT
ncbi:UNVERIFIED_CONTAM: Retrovirus-related Pol polyprotein from transposon RE1 [Sesamum latifolium]|uniref:Retrovirus-related Pol polyprotein from transposon RE1 n=1 Tax=Sesamum latifolium TaxID=2727402 RepID=A0AAW2Y018_9LAMI